MPSRTAAVFIAFILFWSAFATYGQARAVAPLAPAQLEMNALADPLQQERSGTATPAQADDSTAPAELEGGADSPVIQQLAEARVPALTMARPSPPPATRWQAPTLDGLRRPPRAGLLSA